MKGAKGHISPTLRGTPRSPEQRAKTRKGLEAMIRATEECGGYDLERSGVEMVRDSEGWLCPVGYRNHETNLRGEVIEYWTTEPVESYDEALLRCVLHREDGPTVEISYPDGVPKAQLWFFNGRLHREDGPAEMALLPDGGAQVELWYLNGLLHREDGSAALYYERDGSIQTAFNFENGRALGAVR